MTACLPSLIHCSASLVCCRTGHPSARRPEVGDDEPDSGEQLPGMELNFRHHPPWRLPTGGLIEKSLAPHHRFVTGPSYRARQQLPYVAFQSIVGRQADSVLYVPFFQCRVKFRFGEGGLPPENSAELR